LELNVGECSASHPSRLIPEEKALNTGIHIDPKGYWQCHVTHSITGFTLPPLCWLVLCFVKKVSVGILTPLLQAKLEIPIVIMQKKIKMFC